MIFTIEKIRFPEEDFDRYSVCQDGQCIDLLDTLKEAKEVAERLKGKFST